jgi:hypothetical protein
MKSIVIIGLLLCARLSFADESTNIIAVSDWSKPVQLRRMDTGHDHDIRGRVLIFSGAEPAYGGPESTNRIMTFIELQNVTGAHGENVDVHTGEMKFDLKDQNGKAAPEPRIVAGSYPSAIGSGPCWESLPYNSTIRLFVISGSKSPLTITKNGDPFSYWEIPAHDTNSYYLSGTLEIYSSTNGLDTVFSGKEFQELKWKIYNQTCKATILFPAVKIVPSEILKGTKKSKQE